MRTEGDFIRLNKKLLPLSWLYGLGVGFRNMLFEMGILRSRSFNIPVISVGNITVGGTGKTPHVEYLIQLLKDKMNVAVLSRGYKRKSHGFVLAEKDTPMQTIGDEPYQMKQKFPEVTVAVDAKRTRGIEKLTEDKSEQGIDVVLLDDAFQHRYVKPGLNILLVDYHRLVVYDKLMPAGRLREPVKSKDRADIVIITKCPRDLKPMEFRVITKAMKLYPYQKLFFSALEYGNLCPLFPDKAKAVPATNEAIAGKNVLLLTGIASPKQMKHDLMHKVAQLTPMAFGDHHQFKKSDARHINETFHDLPGPKMIITTEKDATRLTSVEDLSDEVRQNIYVLPIRIHIMLDQEEEFNNSIIKYVRKNSRNSILVKGKNDHKSQDSYRSGDRPRTISFRNN